MAEGTFKIPLGTYYETSRNVKSKVTELANDVENNFLNQVSRHIGRPRYRNRRKLFSLYNC